jgi:DNA polymerase
MIAATGDTLAVPLLYYGAGTGRMSGLDGINLQNLTKKSAIRGVLTAPNGYKLISADLSQIEARLVAALAQQTDLLHLFSLGRDVYSEFATRLYGYRVTDCPATAAERFVGKCAILQLGYGAGADKYRDSMLSFGVVLDDKEAKRIVNTYRRTFTSITNLWHALGADGSAALRGAVDVYKRGPVLFMRNMVVLPNSMPMMYPSTRLDSVTYETVYSSMRGRSVESAVKIYGGMLTENICQALARIVLSTAEVRLARRNIFAAMNIHDELVFVVKEAHVDAVSLAIRRVLCEPVSWLPSLPIACSIKVGATYKDTK